MLFGAVTKARSFMRPPQFGAPQRAVIDTGNQEPTLAKLSGLRGESIVVTPYYLFEPKKESLAILLQCTSRDSERRALSPQDAR
jgi:hypothetical protein